MISSHSHSGQFCLHAKDKLEEVVKRAMEVGFIEYGLSEHQPRYSIRHLYPEEQDYSHHYLVLQFHDYVMESRRLKEKYKDKIKLFVGMETEFIQPDYYLNEIENIRQIYHLDYLVGSVHHVREIPIDFSPDMFRKCLETHFGGDHQRMFQEYFDLQYQLLHSIKPKVVGHFDLVRKYAPDIPLSNDTLALVERNVDLIVSYGGLVEYNTRGKHPFSDILEIMVCKGCKFTVSDDSHSIDSVGFGYSDAISTLKSVGVVDVYGLSGQKYTLENKIYTVQSYTFYFYLFLYSTNLFRLMNMSHSLSRANRPSW